MLTPHFLRGDSLNQPPVNPGATDSTEAEPIIDFKAIANWVGFGKRSAGRHKKLIGGIALALALVAGIAVAILPKTYHVETKLLAQKNVALALKADNGEDPTRAAADTVLRRENMVALVKRIDLVKQSKLRRAPALRLKDWIQSKLGTPQNEAEQIDGMARYLAEKLNVWAADGTVTIQLDWPDGNLAYSIVQEAQNTFLEARHIQEIAAISEAESIKEGHASDLRSQIDKAVQEILTLRENKDKEKKDGETKAAAKKEAAAAEKPVGAAPAPAAPPAPSEESIAAKRRLAELSVVIEGKERAIAGLDEFRRRRVAELQAKLEEQRAVYTEAHPAIADLKQAIASASQDSPQMATLRNELGGLNREAEQLRALTGTPAPVATGGFRGGGGGGAKKDDLSHDVIRIEQEPAEDRDPEIVFARSRLHFAIQEYQALQTQIQATRLDLDTSQAAFKYRYAVVVPAEIPKGPIKPKAPMVIISALIGGLLIGVFAAIVMDLRRGKIIEAWQIQSMLGLPVLTEMRVPEPALKPGTPGA
jgi:uncharacterized protein involved in exopolysaccharide biosynthesis